MCWGGRSCCSTAARFWRSGLSVTELLHPSAAAAAGGAAGTSTKTCGTTGTSSSTDGTETTATCGTTRSPSPKTCAARSSHSWRDLLGQWRAVGTLRAHDDDASLLPPLRSLGNAPLRSLGNAPLPLFPSRSELSCPWLSSEVDRLSNSSTAPLKVEKAKAAASTSASKDSRRHSSGSRPEVHTTAAAAARSTAAAERPVSTAVGSGDGEMNSLAVPWARTDAARSSQSGFARLQRGASGASSSCSLLPLSSSSLSRCRSSSRSFSCIHDRGLASAGLGFGFFFFFCSFQSLRDFPRRPGKNFGCWRASLASPQTSTRTPGGRNCDSQLTQLLSRLRRLLASSSFDLELLDFSSRRSRIWKSRGDDDSNGDCRDGDPRPSWVGRPVTTTRAASWPGGSNAAAGGLRSSPSSFSSASSSWVELK
mmetsp:Transcript_6389/g.18733  ORF Transcript_6389/g.18733 Transcript_6389/m.18733 type:complete len:423 (+) Transcript_6389:4476-5744(+)